MKSVIAENGRAALIVLAGSFVVADWAAADVPDVPRAAVAAATAQATASDDDPGTVQAKPRARDRLLELVVEYLEVAFARDAQVARTAQLEPQALAVVQ